MDSNNNSANMKLSPGMMCLVIGCKSIPVNIGKLVTLGEYVLKGSLNLSGNRYKVSGWLCYGKGLFSLGGGVPVYGERGLFLPEHLMPIRPEEDPLEMSMQSIEDYLDSKQKEKS